MSRRASVFARQNPGRRRVRFPDEIVFEESIKVSAIFYSLQKMREK